MFPAPGNEPEAAPTTLTAGMTTTQVFRIFEGRLDILAQQLATAVQAIQQLIIQTAPACATCLHEERGGGRPGHNLANTVIDGTAFCNEHLDDVNGRLVPRKSSGLIITGG